MESCASFSSEPRREKQGALEVEAFGSKATLPCRPRHLAAHVGEEGPRMLDERTPEMLLVPGLGAGSCTASISHAAGVPDDPRGRSPWLRARPLPPSCFSWRGPPTPRSCSRGVWGTEGEGAAEGRDVPLADRKLHAWAGASASLLPSPLATLAAGSRQQGRGAVKFRGTPPRQGTRIVPGSKSGTRAGCRATSVSPYAMPAAQERKVSAPLT
eukprot:CAMPEP_0117539980 /NCGR_PEP_ID=MMETSP0784-20121206/43264_1 /TAXON_ID=39447 /ORGANISM="" /LENGTH=212 /DNA_ID=CAMNT_0005336623 /DNA_START=103 /DNA_END=739 /DNA_ORIENTATION=-